MTNDKNQITKKLRRLIYIVVIGILVSSVPAFSDERPAIPPFTKSDRVLILAPHPDDESIGTGGVIQEALKAGSEVKVVYFTNGDHNELAFIIYEKRLVLFKRQFIRMGELRRQEAINGVKSLGLGPDRLVFLGYPDFGTLHIMARYWGGEKPFKDILTRISKVSYPEALSPGAAYIGENILRDMKTVLDDFKPTKIFVSHPADSNPDHQSLYLFLRVALWDLAGRIGNPEIFPYLIHVHKWPLPRGYHPDIELVRPADLGSIVWKTLPLSREEIKAKHDAISYYKSQIEYDPPYLYTFARKNELFSDYDDMTLKWQDGGALLWQDANVGLQKVGLGGWREGTADKLVSGLAYASDGNSLYTKIELKRKIEKDIGISFFLFGHSKNEDFARMPKLKVSISIQGLIIKDKTLTIKADDCRLVYQGKVVVVKIPLALLGNPDHILARARTWKQELPLEATAWRAIEIKK